MGLNDELAVGLSPVRCDLCQELVRRNPRRSGQMQLIPDLLTDRFRVTSVLLGIFAVVALFITLVGVSGTLALSVARQSKEFGIRIALGGDKTEHLERRVDSRHDSCADGFRLGLAGCSVRHTCVGEITISYQTR